MIATIDYGFGIGSLY